MERPCEHCGQVFKFAAYRSATAKYCSRSCQALAARVQIESSCEICGESFSHISSRCNTAKYCSRTCYYKSLKGKGEKSYSCVHCGNKFFDSPSKNRKYCSIACVSKTKKSDWTATFQTVRKSMIRRGAIQQCERCGYHECKQILGVHHKDRDRNNNSLKNLEVLCPNCHSIEHMKHTPHGFKE